MMDGTGSRAASTLSAASAPDGRRTRWNEHRLTRQGELVDAAVAAIRLHGPSVGMEEVAAQAGTSKAAVYRYFADREQLYLAVCRRVSDRLVDQLSAVLHEFVDPRDQLRGAIDVYLRVIEADPQLYRFVVHRPLSDADPVRGLSALVGEHVAVLIAARLRRAGVDPTPAGPWGHGIVGLVRSAAEQWLDGGSAMNRPELCDHLTDLAWSGLAGIVAATGYQVDATVSVRRAT